MACPKLGVEGVKWPDLNWELKGLNGLTLLRCKHIVLRHLVISNTYPTVIVFVEDLWWNGLGVSHQLSHLLLCAFISRYINVHYGSPLVGIPQDHLDLLLVFLDLEGEGGGGGGGGSRGSSSYISMHNGLE